MAELVRKLVEERIGNNTDALEIVEDRLACLAEHIPQPRIAPGCDCDDIRCPHKSSVSPLALYFFGEHLNNCVKIKNGFFDRFDPTQYRPIEMEKEPSYHIPDGETLNDLYIRYCIGIPTEKYDAQRSGYLIRRYFYNLIEGFVFDPVDEVTSIEIRFNGEGPEFKVVSDRFLPKGFFIPVLLMPYTHVCLSIHTRKQRDAKVGFKMMCGDFSHLVSLRDIQGIQWNKSFEHLGEAYTVRVAGCVGIMMKGKVGLTEAGEW